MYKYIYKNKLSGAYTHAHRPINRDYLELVSKSEEVVKTKKTVMTPNEFNVKSEVFDKPRVFRQRRSK